VRKPYEQLLVADGDQVWFWDRDLNQVTVRRIGEAMGRHPRGHPLRQRRPRPQLR
jgi:outer membrane lipoprotein carrier protein